ncbi:hypothetical protein MLD38_026884 [Melastoma candidum]|uniref:Uncharacterized protein n=1 Tax=Melastoma candidum TaxID=119954 RepID=A0ACB9NZR2_9MYRT|nr:hypothetical protein MLD38_026884 [Melastoma candidum]
MSSKCPNHEHKWRKFWRRAFQIGLVIFFILLLVVLITFAVLHPHKPRFVLQDATVYAFNVSTYPPNLLTSTFQVTILAHNPNDNIAIYYDWLDVYATYHDQQITLRSRIPPTYADHKEDDVWSPFIYGNSIPIAPYNAVLLSQDEGSGTVTVDIKIDGRLRWRVGAVTTGTYHIFVRCPAFISFGRESTGVSTGNNAVKYQLMQSCSVSV